MKKFNINDVTLILLYDILNAKKNPKVKTEYEVVSKKLFHRFLHDGTTVEMVLNDKIELENIEYPGINFFMSLIDKSSPWFKGVVGRALTPYRLVSLFVAEFNRINKYIYKPDNKVKFIESAYESGNIIVDIISKYPTEVKNHLEEWCLNIINGYNNKTVRVDEENNVAIIEIDYTYKGYVIDLVLTTYTYADIGTYPVKPYTALGKKLFQLTKDVKNLPYKFIVPTDFGYIEIYKHYCSNTFYANNVLY